VDELGGNVASLNVLCQGVFHLFGEIVGQGGK
jgi:hypothetical protein